MKDKTVGLLITQIETDILTLVLELEILILIGIYNKLKIKYMQETEIKWDEYGNPIIYPEQEEKIEIEEKSLVINLLEKLKNGYIRKKN
jgi:hypothetical protein